MLQLTLKPEWNLLFTFILILTMKAIPLLLSLQIAEFYEFDFICSFKCYEPNYGKITSFHSFSPLYNIMGCCVLDCQIAFLSLLLSEISCGMAHIPFILSNWLHLLRIMVCYFKLHVTLLVALSKKSVVMGFVVC